MRKWRWIRSSRSATRSSPPTRKSCACPSDWAEPHFKVRSAAENDSMTAVEVVDVLREGIWVLLKVAGPAMIVSLAIGLAISLIQALTQLQEPTLTFVPKVLAIFGTLIITMPFMIGTMVTFMEHLAQRIAGLQ